VGARFGIYLSEQIGKTCVLHCPDFLKQGLEARMILIHERNAQNEIWRRHL
jgi:hypothetical protein